tara:strand:- start:387 stop:1049 length:663 start_codon:yes stop_codon:yes gene_type:complete
MVLIEGGEDSIASYNYTDLEDGQGIITYYLYTGKDENGTQFRFAKETPISKNTTLPLTINDYTANVDYTYTFDTGKFNTPRVVSGNAAISFQAGLKSPGGGCNMVVKLKMYHYDGSTATQFGDTWTSETIATAGGSTKSTPMNAIIDLPLQKFKRDEQIRIDVIVRITTNNADEWEIGIDPANLDSSGPEAGIGTPILTPSTESKHSTVFSLRIPFRLAR